MLAKLILFCQKRGAQLGPCCVPSGPKNFSELRLVIMNLVESKETEQRLKIKMQFTREGDGKLYEEIAKLFSGCPKRSRSSRVKLLLWETWISELGMENRVAANAKKVNEDVPKSEPRTTTSKPSATIAANSSNVLKDTPHEPKVPSYMEQLRGEVIDFNFD